MSVSNWLRFYESGFQGVKKPLVTKWSKNVKKPSEVILGVADCREHLVVCTRRQVPVRRVTASGFGHRGLIPAQEGIQPPFLGQYRGHGGYARVPLVPALALELDQAGVVGQEAPGERQVCQRVFMGAMDTGGVWQGPKLGQGVAHLGR